MRRARAVRGRKPRKWNASACSPATESAAVTAEGQAPPRPESLRPPLPLRATLRGRLRRARPASVTSATVAGAERFEQRRRPLSSVVLVVAERSGSEAQVAEQLTRSTRILSRDQGNLAKHARRSGGEVFEIAYRGGYDVERCGHWWRSCSGYEARSVNGMLCLYPIRIRLRWAASATISGRRDATGYPLPHHESGRSQETGMDTLYTEEERLLRSTMREFADARLRRTRHDGTRTRSSRGQASKAMKGMGPDGHDGEDSRAPALERPTPSLPRC